MVSKHSPYFTSGTVIELSAMFVASITFLTLPIVFFMANSLWSLPIAECRIATEISVLGFLKRKSMI